MSYWLSVRIISTLERVAPSIDRFWIGGCGSSVFEPDRRALATLWRPRRIAGNDNPFEVVQSITRDAK